MVWPKFKIARSPPSVSSWPTTSALISQQRATTSASVFGSRRKSFGRSRSSRAKSFASEMMPYFDDLGQTGAVFTHRQGVQRVEIAQHEPRLVKSAHEIFPGPSD